MMGKLGKMMGGMEGMDDMRGMRLKAKSKYLEDLLSDNDGKMAMEIKKTYSPEGEIEEKEIELKRNGEEEEENGMEAEKKRLFGATMTGNELDLADPELLRKLKEMLGTELE